MVKLLQSGLYTCKPTLQGLCTSTWLSLFFTHLSNTHEHFFCCRPKWISLASTKYSYLDYVLVGWQDDDLPLFGRIHEILVINSTALFQVCKYTTLGIDRHYHSFCIEKQSNTAFYWLSELVDYYPYEGHVLLNGCLYVTFRSHIPKYISFFRT